MVISFVLLLILKEEGVFWFVASAISSKSSSLSCKSITSIAHKSPSLQQCLRSGIFICLGGFYWAGYWIGNANWTSMPTCSIANQIYYNVHVHGSSFQHMNEIEASIIYLIANIQKNRRVLSISGRVREVLYWAFGSYDTVDVNSSSNFAWTNATFALKGLNNHRISDYKVKYSSIFLMVLNCIGIWNMEVESLRYISWLFH